MSGDRRAELQGQRDDRATMRDRAAQYARELDGTTQGAEWRLKAEALASEIYDLDKVLRKLG